MTIFGFDRKLGALDISKVAVASLNDTAEDRIELNREQLQSGLRSDGSDILPSYTDETVRIKRLKGQETRFVNLKDTGKWQADIKSKINGQVITTESIDYKNEKLKKKYETSKGKLFGLNKDSKVEYKEKSLQPAFQVNVRKQIGL